MKKSGSSSSAGTIICSMNFCPNCAILLDLEEDEKRKVAVLTCPACHYQEMAENNFKMRYEANQDLQALRDAHQDPTLPRAKDVSCPVCGHQKDEIYVANMEERMVPTYACLNPTCGDPNGRRKDQNSD
ncbi:hypothetical protein IEQ34_013961 [Dendrobium chrysotoxum]|uniref:DNA-directed RNA polymerase subunit n=1 Tax=Dendrobium chrysotoxum TaxID=161865 RepID=A0AAV7GK00_DENCH|nr:hypothetical protein IEQ34_013961 [Dendrobium chrysotoxum]